MPRRDAMLGDAELEVLKVLWDRGPLTVREVLGILQERGRDLAYTTVLTMMTRLEAKGAVASNRSGPAYVYRPRVSRDRIRRDRLKGLVEQLFDGAPGSLVLSLMKSESFTPEELAEFRGLIERLDPARRARHVAGDTDATENGRGAA
ncbi:MAG: BlaI/MecI/CopY family transcriptional regulator [Phycisphaerales bacterium]|nr:BlaI/MecI/CopY family transcriptional regulator [Phycisphaerales bacterium]MCB9840151.1 BlaI/MecI/CopY family transcriptional regulator [Phycisphaeraceae bacterium]